MHETPGADDLPTEMVHETLVTQADAEDGTRVGKCRDHVEGNAGILGASRARRNNEVRWIDRPRVLDRNGVVAVHDDLGAKRSECLHQVVGKRIVVIDQQHADMAEFAPARHLETLACHFECPPQDRALCQHFLVFPGRHGIGNDSGARLEAVFVTGKDQRTNRNRLVHVA